MIFFLSIQFANRAKRVVLDGRNLRAAAADRNNSSPKKTVPYEEFLELAKAFQQEKFLREQLEEALHNSSN